MIIHSHIRLKPGEVIIGPILAPDRQDHIITFLVVRETTKQEFIDFVTEMGISYNPEYITGEYFYEIHMD